VILVDTSVWIEHLRRGLPALAAELEAGTILMHPFVLGELACGHLNRRREILKLCADLPQAPMARDDEALRFIEARTLMGRGIGYVDVHLLAATALAPARLWTLDKRSADTSSALGLAHKLHAVANKGGSSCTSDRNGLTTRTRP
jgi:predicted nucleic acid-binding protein